MYPTVWRNNCGENGGLARDGDIFVVSGYDAEGKDIIGDWKTLKA